MYETQNINLQGTNTSLQTTIFGTFSTSVDSPACMQYCIRKQNLQLHQSFQSKWLMMKMLPMDDFTGLMTGIIVLLESD